MPFGENEQNTKKSFYRITDPFLNFYFTYVIPNRSLIELDKGTALLQRLMVNFTGYTAFWWEKLCRQAVSGSVIGSYTFGYSRSWWGNISKDERIEIDVVAESTDGKALLIGECKWTESENGARLIFELEEKAKKLPFVAGKEIILCLFLKNSPVDIISQKVFLPDDIVMLLK